MDQHQFLTSLRKKDIILRVDDDGTLDIEARKGILTPDIIEQIKTRKAELVDYLQTTKVQQTAPEKIPAAATAPAYPLSSSQLRLWILQQANSRSVAYNIPAVMEMDGLVDPAKYELAIHTVMERHDILRTLFRQDETGTARQHILPPGLMSCSVTFHDYSTDAAAREKAAALIKADEKIPFDLDRCPLFRVIIFQLPNLRYLFYYNMHHIISDEWSMELLRKEVLAAYHALAAGSTPEWPPLPIQYKDYAVWQQQQLLSGKLDAHRLYWLEQLSGTLPVLDLPGSKTRPPVLTQNGYALAAVIDAASTGALRSLCGQHKATLFMGLVSVLKLLLHHYTGLDDIIVGSPVAGREHPELENQIGFYLNTLALRTRFSKDQSFTELLEKVRNTTLAAYQHQLYPFDQLVAERWQQRDGSRSPVFDLFIDLHAAGPQEENNHSVTLLNGHTDIQDKGPRSGKFDITFIFEEAAGALYLEVEFNADIYDKTMISRLIRHYQLLLTAVTTHASQPVGRLSWLPEQEQRLLLDLFAGPALAFPEEKTVLDLFREQAVLSPDAIALVYGKEHMSYKELDEQSNRLAAYLKQQGIREDVLVPVCLDRSPELLVSILGILKAGGAFVPVDPAYPKERITYILSQSRAPLLISHTYYKDLLEDLPGISRFYADRDWIAVNMMPAGEINPGPAQQQLAYVIYTSGSTGRPKGVAVSHHNLSNYLHCIKQIYLTQLDEGNFGLYSSLSFDLTITSLFGALIRGKQLHIFPQEMDITEILHDYLQPESGLDIIKLTPSHIAVIASLGLKSTGIKKAIVGGEALQPRHIDILRRLNKDILIYNEYGPTETTVGCTVALISEAEDAISIGKPLYNNRIYILDDQRLPVPVGIAGEIYIGGAQVARGYWLQESLTTERFIPDPFSEGLRLYRTGDKALWTNNGNILYLGRTDDQLKIRGHRIEPGEIEQALLEWPGITEAAVNLLRQDEEDELIAYIVGDATWAQEDLQQWLFNRLPAWMVPAHFVPLENIPLTPNGKLDKRALPLPAALTQNKARYIAPRNAVEGKIVSVWQEVLKHQDLIGVEEDFFSLGGHSLRITQLMNQYYREFEVKVSMQELFQHKTIAAHAALIAGMAATAYSDIKQAPEAALYPVSDGQRRLWVLSQIGNNTQAYHLQGQLALQGAYTAADFSAAIDLVIQRHEILRTVFVENESGELCQQILPPVSLMFELEYADFENTAPDTVQSYIRDAASKAFDLAKGPLFRAGLIRLAPEQYLFHYTMHHIISDGWSVQLLSREIMASYRAFEKNESPDLPPLRIQYKDFAVWQLGQLTTERLDSHRAYWLQQLGGMLPVLDLPIASTRPPLLTHNGHVLSLILDGEPVTMLRGLCREENATLFMGLLAVMNALLYRYTGEEDIIIGSPVAGREHIELESQIGFYLNMLALRVRFNGSDSFRELLKKVREVSLLAYQHQSYPFDRLVDELDIKRDISRSALFDVMAVLQNHGHKDMTDEDPVSAAGITDEGFSAVKCDLNFDFTERKEAIYLRVEFNTDIYDRESIARLAGHFKRLLEAAAAKPDIPVDRIGYLSAAEQQQLLSAFNDTAAAYPEDKTILHLLEEQALLTPDVVAVTCGAMQYSYKALVEAINRFAACLHSRGIGAESLVPVCMSRSAALVPVIFGILKAGAAYVPVDPEYPAERIAFILEDTGAKMVVCNTAEKLALPADKTCELIEIEIDHEWDAIMASGAIPPMACNPRGLAYVIYTSGSTGRPKGVMIEHRSLMNIATGMRQLVPLDHTDHLLAITSISFDISIIELLWTVSNGISITIREDSREMNGFDRFDATFIQITPSYLSALVDDPASRQFLKGLRHIIIGGEQLFPPLLEKLAACTHAAIYNLYGPTETTIWSSGRKLDITGRITAGQPIQNTKIYILDQAGSLCPVGVTGELCIAGHGLARGYLQAPALTRLQFVQDPFDDDPAAYMYRTGDLAKWHADGNIEIIGRNDDQVKVRGYRIELGEIETVLRQCSLVKDAAVIVKDNGAGDKYLVSFVVPEDNFEQDAVLHYLKSRLPAYMLPGWLIPLSQLPLTPNGKKDRKALLLLAGENPVTRHYVAPRNEQETALAGIWESLLNIQQVGIYEDFFALGGHSLTAIRLGSMIRKQLEVEIPVKDLFSHSTIAAQAALLQEYTAAPLLPSLEAGERPALVPLSYSQERLWFIDQSKGSIQYHVPIVLKLNGELNAAALSYALQQLVARHEVLRTVIGQDNVYAYQRVLALDNWQPDIMEGAAYRENDTALQELVSALVSAPFDLSMDYMLRATLIRLQEHEHMLVMVLHHIAFDGWSKAIFIRELAELFTAFTESRSAVLPVLPIQCADYAIWQRKYLTEELLDRKLFYWQRRLAGAETLHLPADFPRPAIQSIKGAALEFYVPAALKDRLLGLSRDHGATLFMTLLAAFKVLLYRYSGQQDIVVGTPVANRGHHELEGLIGFFVNTLVLRTDLSEPGSFLSLLQQVKETALAAYEHQDTPFEKIVEKVLKSRDMSRSPLVQAMFVFQHAVENTPLSLGAGLEVTQMVVEHTTSQFDLTFSISEVDEGLRIEIQYCTDLFTRQRMSRMGTHYLALLEAISANPGQNIATLPLLSPPETQLLLEAGNNLPVAYPDDLTLTDLLERQAKATPDNIALVFQDQYITYRELDERSNRLANYLRSRGVQEETLVPICMERSDDMIVGILGILKAGGAYVPVDPDYPEERIAFVLEDTNARLIVTQQRMQDLLEKYSHIDKIYLDRDAEQIAAAAADAPPRSLRPHHLCYIIYTSGSTGRPKGVMIMHQNVVRLFETDNPLYDFKETDVWTMFHSYCFDFSVWEIFGALLYGGRLVIVPKNTAVDTMLFADMLMEEGVTVLNQTPNAFYMLSAEVLNSYRELSLRYVIFGGESLDPLRLKKWKEAYPDCRLVNMYGITETTVHVTYQEIGLREITAGTNRVGKPIPTLYCYLLDKQQQPVPVGIAGEIYVGGMGLARGYLNRDALTKERFIVDPYRKEQRLYKTGDLGRWLEDGGIEYLGRMDEQVKIHGYRIELGEIEHALLELEGISAVLVTMRSGEHDMKFLAAYIVSEKPYDSKTLRRQLLDRLPDYMVPAYFVQLPALPLTPNGKIDHDALPRPEISGISTGVEYIAPRNETEQALAESYAQVLEKDQVGVGESFLDLGGDSIKAILLATRLKQQGYLIKVGDILRYPVLEDLALRTRITARTASQSAVEGDVRLTPIQRWFLQGSYPNKSHYNQSVLLYSSAALDESVLDKCLETLVGHHDALRMVFEEVNGVWKQYNRGMESKLYQLDVHDLREMDDQPRAMGTYSEQLQQSFLLESGPLLKAALYRLSDGDRLLLVIHHLVVDGVSWRILLEDLSTLYRQIESGQTPSLPDKGDSFRDWAEQLYRYANSEALETQQDYWLAALSHTGDGLPVNGTAARLLKDNVAYGFELDEELTGLLLKRINRVYNTEINDTLLAALCKAAGETFLLPTVLVELEGHGREEILPDINISRTISWFTTLYPVLLDTGRSGNITDLLIETKEQLRRIPLKGIGYGLLRYLKDGGVPALETIRKTDITFNYLGDFGSGVSSASGEQLFRYATEYKGPDVDEIYELQSPLDVSGLVVNGRLKIDIRYSNRQFNSKMIVNLADRYEHYVKELIRLLKDEQQSYVTPGDLTFKALSAAELMRLNTTGDIEDLYELSPLQEGIYFHWLSDPSSLAYVEQMSYRVEGRLDLSVLEKSYAFLVNRHAILRTSFQHAYASKNLQIVRRSVPADFRYKQLNGAADIELEVSRFKDEDRHEGFDLNNGSQMRLTVLDLGGHLYEFIWSHHHILMDGWCSGVLIHEFNRIYRSLADNKTLELGQVYPYANYIKWLSGLNRRQSTSYWQQYLGDYESLSAVPFRQQAAARLAYRSAEVELRLPVELVSLMRKRCRELGITENTFIQCAWGFLLSRYNNTRDVVFGTVVSGRPEELAGVAGMIGLFINTIPVRIRYSPDMTVADLLRNVQTAAIECIPHHYMQLSDIQSGHVLRNNLFDHILIYENYPVQEMVATGFAEEAKDEGGKGLQELTLLSSDSEDQSNYDFNIAVLPAGDAIRFRLRYNSEYYSKENVLRIKTHFEQVIASFAGTVEDRLSSVSYLPAAERTGLLEIFKGKTAGAAPDKTILDLWTAQAAKLPDATAVVYEGETLSYLELDLRSNKLAHYLRKHGVKEESLVPLCIDRSTEMIVGMLGILKAGAAYVPIDPTYPQERIAYILSDIKAQLIITHTYYRDLLDDQPDLFKLYMDRDWTAVELEPAQPPATALLPHHLAYVIYTSGSTGTPKGVMIEHRAVVNLVYNQVEPLGLHAGISVFQFASFSFDASCHEIFCTLLHGGKLVLAPAEMLKDIDSLCWLLDKHQVELITLPPSYLSLMKDRSLNIKTVISAGEMLDGKLASQIQQKGIKLINAYGPTENTVSAVLSEMPLHDSGVVTIGKPIDNVLAYVLDEHMQPAGVGISGELYLGGAQVARGYLHRPELTAEKFIPDPFSDQPGARLYRTGDMARWLPDGNMEFMGRIDNQVKVRGFRIELGEIEHALLQHTLIREAAVIVSEFVPGYNELVAYIVSDQAIPANEIKAFMESHLPAYMIPEQYIPLKKLPLTHNGKVDRKSLLTVRDIATLNGKKHTAAANTVEIRLLKQIALALGRSMDEIGVEDNFFDMGANSLLLIRIVSAINHEFNKELKVVALFECPNVKILAATHFSDELKAVSTQ